LGLLCQELVPGHQLHSGQLALPLLHSLLAKTSPAAVVLEVVTALLVLLVPNWLLLHLAPHQRALLVLPADSPVLLPMQDQMLLHLFRQQ
jgi:hypothetical protein